jgi:hypothetical protein
MPGSTSSPSVLSLSSGFLITPSYLLSCVQTPADNSLPRPQLLTPDLPPLLPIIVPAMAARVMMPSRSHSTTPKFNPDQPHKLCHYFSKLGVQPLVSGITNKQDQKRSAIRYLDIDSAKLWESLAQFDPASTYEEFTAAVYKLYPGSEDEHKWSVADMERLVEDQVCSGIANVADLGAYHRSFLTITSFLHKRTASPKQNRDTASIPQSVNVILWEQ